MATPLIKCSLNCSPGCLAPDLKPKAMLQGAYTTLNDLIALRISAQGMTLKRLLQMSARQTGNHRSRLLGRGMEFEEVRAYVAGDDTRTIDWRVTARTGKPHTKIFTEEKEQQALVVLDQSPSMFFASRKRMKSVAAAEAAALIIWTALQENHRIGGLSFGPQGAELFRPSSRRARALQFLQSIQAQNQRLNTPYEHAGEDSLTDALAQIAHISRTRSLVFILSDFELSDAGFESLKRRLMQLSRRHNIVLGLVYDALERALPSSGVFHLTDGTHKQAVDSSYTQDASRYAEHFQNKHNRLTELSRMHNVQMLSLATDQDSKSLFLYNSSR